MTFWSTFSNAGGDRQHNERTHLLEPERNAVASGNRSVDDSAAVDVGGREGEPAAAAATNRTLDTFEGVFAPVSLSMLSSILFLRVGYIVGNAGILLTLVQLGIAYTILIATVLSICAIATNGAVEGGGVYYMISRTLGLEVGGAIGSLFWFANGVSSALYLSACAEGIIGSFGVSAGSLAQILPEGHWWPFLYCSILNSLNLLVCLFGAKIFGKTSTLILGAVVFCTAMTVASFFSDLEYHATFVFNATGADCLPPVGNATSPNCTKVVNGSFVGLWGASPNASRATFVSNLLPKFSFDCSNADASVDFFKVFGVLFSGVTGIMSGANMSGELISPSRNIPRGTLSACLFTLSVLTVMAMLSALTCSPEFLLHDCMYLSDFSFWSGVVAIGVFLATFSASLNNLIGASRVMEAVGKDILVGKLQSVVERPIFCVFFTWVIVEFLLLIGSLNSIAQLCSVLFLLSYASVNLACLGLDAASAPNFRPSFKYFCWQTCLIGLVGTSVMMCCISFTFAAVGVFLCCGLIIALNLLLPVRKENWGSIIQALLFHQVRKYLLLLDPRKDHVKFWRPQILLLVSNPRTSCSLIDFVNTVKKGGLYVIGHVYNDRLGDLDEDPCFVHHFHWLALVDHLSVKAFVELTLAGSLREGFGHLARVSGIGAMKPNTVVMGYLDDTFHGDDLLSQSSPFATDKFETAFPQLRPTATTAEQQSARRISKLDFVGTVCDMIKMGKNVCLCRHFQRQLKKDSLFGPERESIFGTRAKKKLFLDVFLIDFLSVDATPIEDHTSLFLLQLASIVNTVPRWKKMRLRVFIADDCGGHQQLLLLKLLERQRIVAEPHVLPLMPPPVAGDVADAPGPSFVDYKSEISQHYLNKTSEMIRGKSADTAVTFLYMPLPPKDASEHETYLDRLTTLTEQWPPTMLARGVLPVTLTTL